MCYQCLTGSFTTSPRQKGSKRAKLRKRRRPVANNADRAGSVADAQRAKKRKPPVPKSLGSMGITPIPAQQPGPTVVDPFKPGGPIVKDPLKRA